MCDGEKSVGRGKACVCEEKGSVVCVCVVREGRCAV